jgi:Gp5 N-terminal OB domain
MTELMGAEGFTWFIGEVVKTDSDTLKLGRVKIRAYHWHDDFREEQLPHAQLMTPPTSASLKGVGISPTGMAVGTRVIGFFADGRAGQHPIIMGSFHIIEDNKPDLHAVSPLARGEQDALNKVTPKDENSWTTTGGVQGAEPKPAYAAQYPHNKTFTTEAGHVVEFDDTPGHERIHVYHKDRSYIEIQPGGTMVTHVNGDSVEVDMQNKRVTVKGNYGMVIDGDFNTSVMGNYNLVCNGDIRMTSRGAVKVESKKEQTYRSGGSFTYLAPAGMTIAQGMLHINGGFSSAVGKSGSFQGVQGYNIDVCGGIITNISGGNS